MVTIAFSGRIPLAGNLIVLYASLIVFQVFIVYSHRINSFLRLTRDILFPVISIIIIFDSLGLIVHAVNPQDLDYLLIRLDYRLFGGYPTISLEQVMHPLLTDLLQLSYTTYYFLPVALGVSLKLRGKEEEFNHALFLILLCFYLSYIGYILVPALGPRYAMEHLQIQQLKGLFLSGYIQETLNFL
ncbi:MAG: phosphatase PAP2 family protein, partial [Thermodesulfovibrionales bacterium]